MERRHLEKLGIETSLLGFGCMRFPLTKDGKIDEEQSEKMIDRAIAGGVNYIDTAYPYHEGDSEPFVGKVLNKYDRSSYYLATKLPMWLLKTKEDVERIFYEQLQRLDKEYVDFYLLHALNEDTWKLAKELGVVEICKKLKEEGKIRYLGFSFHDEYPVFEEIATYTDWDFCQIQFNYMDTEVQAGVKGYELTEKLGIPLVIMEPIRGGALAGYSDDINAMFYAMDPNASIASWALRWVGSFPNVKVILSGMSAPEQVEDNLNTFTGFNPLSDKEKIQIEEIVQTLRSRVKNGCTGCRYCMPCPAGVNIPFNFQIWNNLHIYDNYDLVKWDWENNMTDGQRPTACIMCGKCETACPQKINIREDLKIVHSDLETARNS